MDAYPEVALMIGGIVVLVFCEAMAFAALRAFGVGPNLGPALANCASGAALLLALLAAVETSPFPVIAGWLSAALLAHILDVAFRWRDSSRAAPRSVPPLAEQSRA